MAAAADPLAVVAAVVIILGGSWGLVFALLRAARHPHPTAMVTALSLLTLLSLIGLGVSDGEAASTFGTLAATGIGALAGAVTSTFQHYRGGKDGQDG